MSTPYRIPLNRSTFDIRKTTFVADIYESCNNEDREFIRDVYRSTYNSEFSLFYFCYTNSELPADSDEDDCESSSMDSALVWDEDFPIPGCDFDYRVLGIEYINSDDHMDCTDVEECDDQPLSSPSIRSAQSPFEILSGYSDDPNLSHLCTGALEQQSASSAVVSTDAICHKRPADDAAIKIPGCQLSTCRDVPEMDNRRTSTEVPIAQCIEGSPKKIIRSLASASLVPSRARNTRRAPLEAFGAALSGFRLFRDWRCNSELLPIIAYKVRRTDTFRVLSVDLLFRETCHSVIFSLDGSVHLDDHQQHLVEDVLFNIRPPILDPGGFCLLVCNTLHHSTHPSRTQCCCDISAPHTQISCG